VLKWIAAPRLIGIIDREAKRIVMPSEEKRAVKTSVPNTLPGVKVRIEDQSAPATVFLLNPTDRRW
jgi:hypothetical protein